MKDRFNKDLRQESQLPSGSGARIRKYKYHRILAFLRPVLARRTTWSSTVGPGSGAVLHQSATDPSQPSSSTAASGPATQPGDQEAGPSGVPLPQSSASSQFFMGSSRQRQRAADRSLMPEFLHLSSVFHQGLKAMGDRLDTAISHISTHIQEVTTALAQVKADLQRPAHHFFNQIEQGMSEHLSPELQITVMQACNAAYVQAMQQSRYFQQTVGAFPTVPTLSRFTSMPTSAAYHCTATSIPNTAGPYYSTTNMPSAVGQPTATTMTTAAPDWASSTATTMLPPQDPGLAFPATTTRVYHAIPQEHSDIPKAFHRSDDQEWNHPIFTHDLDFVISRNAHSHNTRPIHHLLHHLPKSSDDFPHQTSGHLHDVFYNT
ncbi:uncharacterized protein LOC143783228 [Ranitomeya variabilis]|uniref:uncharacterized protein LOC143783228 n=1 Tax=Ranitomeya variabilis TaxID=490064 RepID=UPI004056E386